MSDAWRDTYDDWKLRSPDDDYEQECLHEDYEADINGRATCNHCGHKWWLTDEDIAHEREMCAAAYDRMMRREERRERIQRVVDKVTWVLWRRWRKPPDINDDIPF